MLRSRLKRALPGLVEQLPRRPWSATSSFSRRARLGGRGSSVVMVRVAGMASASWQRSAAMQPSAARQPQRRKRKGRRGGTKTDNPTSPSGTVADKEVNDVLQTLRGSGDLEKHLETLRESSGIVSKKRRLRVARSQVYFNLRQKVRAERRRERESKPIKRMQPGVKAIYKEQLARSDLEQPPPPPLTVDKMPIRSSGDPQMIIPRPAFQLLCWPLSAQDLATWRSSPRTSHVDVDDMCRCSPAVSSHVIQRAVDRNRVRRRLRRVMHTVLSFHAAPRYDYMLLASSGTLWMSMADMLEDLASALDQAGLYTSECAPPVSEDSLLGWTPTRPATFDTSVSPTPFLSASRSNDLPTRLALSLRSAAQARGALQEVLNDLLTLQRVGMWDEGDMHAMVSPLGRHVNPRLVRRRVVKASCELVTPEARMFQRQLILTDDFGLLPAVIESYVKFTF